MNANHLIEALQDPPREFRPVSLWFLNHFLEEDEFHRQIREQEEKGFGGVMCHGRDSLRAAVALPSPARPERVPRAGGPGDQHAQQPVRD